jgi:hypothetical protein
LGDGYIWWAGNGNEILLWFDKLCMLPQLHGSDAYFTVSDLISASHNWDFRVLRTPPIPQFTPFVPVLDLDSALSWTGFFF